MCYITLNFNQDLHKKKPLIKFYFYDLVEKSCKTTSPYFEIKFFENCGVNYITKTQLFVPERIKKFSVLTAFLKPLNMFVFISYLFYKNYN